MIVECGADCVGVITMVVCRDFSFGLSVWGFLSGSLGGGLGLSFWRDLVAGVCLGFVG